MDDQPVGDAGAAADPLSGAAFEALFLPDGDTLVPTPAALGPWAPDLLHGGAMAALCVEMLEDRAEAGFASVRFDADFVRALPLAPLTTEAHLVRIGRRMQLLEGEVRADGKLVTRCSLLQLLPRQIDVPEAFQPRFDAPPDRPREWSPPTTATPTGGPFFGRDAMDVRLADPTVFMGSGLAWFRLRLPVVPGRQPSPMVRVAAAADFGNGISGVFPRKGPPPVTFLNADLSVHLVRPLTGDWVRLESRSTWTDGGIGLTRSELADGRGVLGVAHQSLVLDRPDLTTNGPT